MLALLKSWIGVNDTRTKFNRSGPTVAQQCQVIYLLHHFRISLPTALCQALVEPIGHLRPDMTAKILVQKTKVMPERIKASEKSPSAHSTLLSHIFSQAVSGGAELTWGDVRKPGRERKRRKVKSLLAVIKWHALLANARVINFC